MYEWLLKQLTVNRGEWMVSSALGAAWAFLIGVGSRWILQLSELDVLFIMNMATLVTIDTVAGAVLAFKKKRVSSESFARLFYKVIIYTVVLYSVHMATYGLPVETSFAKKFLIGAVYSTLAFRELLSIVENLQMLGVVKLPPAIQETLSKVEKDLTNKKQ
jgi:phage-related holin